MECKGEEENLEKGIWKEEFSECSSNTDTECSKAETLDTKFIKEECISPEDKNITKQTKINENEDDPRPTNTSNFSWPSLWKNGPRRSAFQPYKPSREVNVPPPLEPRPSSTTVMTNLQRGNIQAESVPVQLQFSWFTLAARGDITVEKLGEMIAEGKDIDCVDEEGLTALMWAAYHGQIYSVQILLGTGKVDVDREGMWGETALMLAATNGHLEVIRLLISAGADINHQDHSGATALMCAVHGDHPHSVSELLSDGADISIHTSDDCTAYDIAVNQKSYKSKAVLEKYMLSLLKMSIT